MYTKVLIIHHQGIVNSQSNCLAYVKRKASSDADAPIRKTLRVSVIPYRALYARLKETTKKSKACGSEADARSPFLTDKKDSCKMDADSNRNAYLGESLFFSN